MSKTHLNEKTFIKLELETTTPIKKLYKFYNMLRNLPSLGRFFVTLPFPMPESSLVTVSQLRTEKKFCHLVRDCIWRTTRGICFKTLCPLKV